MNKHAIAITAALLIVSGFAVAQTSAPATAPAQAPLAQPLADFDKLVSGLRASSVVGEPIRAGDTVIVPFAKISFGLGGGGALTAFGGGMGVKTTSLGVLIVEGDEVRAELFPEEPAPPSILEKILQAVLDKKIVFMGNGVSTSSAPPMQEMVPAIKEMMGGVTVIGNALSVTGDTSGPAEAPKAAPQNPTPAAMQKLFEEKKYADALAMADALIAKNPKDSDLHVWKGRIMGALTQSGNMADMMKYGPGAMQEFETAVKLDPKNAGALIGRAAGKLAAPPGFGGDVDGAIADLEAAVGIKPSPEAYYFLGQAYQKKGQNDKAAEAFKEALKLRPNYPDAAKALTGIK